VFVQSYLGPSWWKKKFETEKKNQNFALGEMIFLPYMEKLFQEKTCRNLRYKKTGCSP